MNTHTAHIMFSEQEKNKIKEYLYNKSGGEGYGTVDFSMATEKFLVTKARISEEAPTGFVIESLTPAVTLNEINNNCSNKTDQYNFISIA